MRGSLENIKKVWTVVFFVLATMLMMIPLSYMLRPSTDENAEYRNRMVGFYAEPKDSLNIVSMGNSAIFRYVNNVVLWKEYGLTSYNFCSPEQSLYALEYLVDEVEKTQSPEVYLVDARQFLLNGSKEQNEVKLHQLIDNMKYSMNRCEIINKSITNWSDRLPYYLDIITYHGNWEQLSKESITYARNAKSQDMKGWVVVNVMREVDALGDVKELSELPIEKDAEKELRYLLDLWEKESKKVVFVSTPWIIDEVSQQKSNYMKRIVEEAGFRYLDANLYQEKMELDYSKDFYNARHVNAAGAEKFSKFLGEYLMQEFQFTRILEESVVKEWKVAEKFYDEKMKAFMEQHDKN